MSRSLAVAFATCLHRVFWVCASGVPSTDLPACLAGQLSGVSIRAKSSWVPSFADCWHAAQFISKASPTLVCSLKNDFIPTSEPPVVSLSLSSMLAGKSGMRAGVGLLDPWFLTSALPMPRLTQSMTQATRPTGHFDTAAEIPNPPSLLGSLILSFTSSHASLPRWAVPSEGHFAPCPMSVAIVSSIFSSNRMKKGSVFEDASIPRPK